MKRDWLRAYQRFGLRPVLTPVVVVLLLWVGLDRWLPDYLTRRADAADLQQQLSTIQTTLDLNAEVERTHLAIKPAYAEVEARAYRGGTLSDAAAQMEVDFAELLRSLYFDGIQTVKADVSTTKTGKTREIALDVQFKGVPQQLPRLEAALERHAKAMRLRRLAVKVNDDPTAGGPLLEISAQVVGIFLVPDDVKPVQPASSAYPKASASASVSAAANAPGKFAKPLNPGAPAR